MPWPGEGKPLLLLVWGQCPGGIPGMHHTILSWRSLCQPVPMEMSLGCLQEGFIAMKATRNGPKWGPRGTAPVKSNLGQGLCSRIQPTCEICPEG